MIAKLRGTLAEKAPGEVVVDVGGVGYHALISLSTFCRLPDTGRPIDLFTVTNLRENALELFGFADRKERAAFMLLRGVSGIGPRMALTILSGISADDLREVLRSGRSERLVAVPGIGKKTAERLLVELRGRIDGFDRPLAGEPAGIERDAISALVALGYREADAAGAVAASRGPADDRIEALIKRALARLA
jgi:holliday junction DNA helicase RuvA